MKDESLAKVIEDMRKRADVAERQDADGQVHHSAVAVMLRDFADRAEAAGAREFSDGATIGHLFGASESRRKAKEDGGSLVPARLALNLCRAIGEEDRERHKEFVRELAKWMDEHGMGELASFAIAQIDDRGTWVPM